MELADKVTKWAFFVVDAQNNGFFVPNNAVKTYCKRPIIHSSASSLRALLKNPALDSWVGLCEPDSMVSIEVAGIGVLVFLSFKFADADGEKQNFGKRLVQIPPSIAAEALAASHKICVDAGRYETANDRATERLNTTKWVPSDCTQQRFDYGALGWLSIDDREAAVEAAGLSVGDDAGPDAVQKVVAAIDEAIKAFPATVKLVPGKYGSGTAAPVSEAPKTKPAAPPKPAPPKPAAPETNGHAEEVEELIADAPSALVTTGNRVPFSKTREELFCPQGKSLFKPLPEHIVLLPKITNEVSPVVFHEIREKRTAPHWKQYLHPDALGVLSVDGVVNLFTTFKVQGYDVEANAFLPSQLIVKEALTSYTIDHAKTPVIDVSTSDGAQRLSLIFGWDPAIIYEDGKQNKVVKLDGAKIPGWTKLGGNWKSPIPKPIKEPAVEGGTTAVTVAPAKKARTNSSSAVTTSSRCFRDDSLWTEISDSPFVEFTKVLKVGKRYRIDDDTFPGYVMITKFRDPLVSDDDDDL